jgi:hypothetical protein
MWGRLLRARIIARSVTVRKALDAGLWITAGLSTGCEFTVTMRLPASKRWSMTDYPPGLTRLLRERDQVLDVLSALDYMSRNGSRGLGPDDIHPVKPPPRTRTARSLVDAASWMATDRGAMAVLAAGVQQRMVRVCDLADVVEHNQRLHRRKIIAETLGDIAGGSQALSELDFMRLVIRPYNLPAQVARCIREALAARA